MRQELDPKERLAWTIALESPLADDLRPLFERHSATMHERSPVESIHMLDAQKLAGPDVRFFVVRVSGWAVAMGALKRIDSGHAEIKSMHVLEELRGLGLAKALLAHMVADARASGFTRLSLETGTHEGFLAARSLYSTWGFEYCDPFDGYLRDPNSVFMTRAV